MSAHYMQLAEECRIRKNAAYARIGRQVNGYGRDIYSVLLNVADHFCFA
ncbi:MAG: hypothetical protein O2966_01925 [Proteobacteria bacterium]|nr:hypothetical protein [Pseudomonadota bacterium]